MKKFIALTLAVLMALTIVGCGKKDKDEDTGEPQYNLENPEPIPDGEEDSQGYIGDGKYRNDIKLSCTLESGYEVTLGMGDKDAGVNAIYLNPTCNDPNGAAFYSASVRHIPYTLCRKNTQRSSGKIFTQWIPTVLQPLLGMTMCWELTRPTAM